MSIAFKQLTHMYNASTPFPYTALENVDLNIKKGTFCAIIGETGSGKTTLVQHLNALLLPTSGEVCVDDFVVSANKNENKNLKQLRKKVGLVFQFPEYQLFEETIVKDICFGPMNFGMSAQEAFERCKEVIRIVGLDESYLERNPFELSGGQKRRVAIAGILAADPDILVLDEPTAGLDPQGAKEMMALFKMLNEKYGKTIVMVTHDMEHVLEYCKEVIVMKKGKVERTCDVKAFFSDLAFLEECNITPPAIIRTRMMLAKQGFNMDGEILDMNHLVQRIKEEVKKHG